jgi:hypothetical protein
MKRALRLQHSPIRRPPIPPQKQPMLLQASYSIRIDERVGEIQIELVAMQTGRKSGRVGIPVKDVEGRLLIAKQIVVDPLIPDQIVRSHPCKHPRQFDGSKDEVVAASRPSACRCDDRLDLGRCLVSVLRPEPVVSQRGHHHDTDNADHDLHPDGAGNLDQHNMCSKG